MKNLECYYDVFWLIYSPCPVLKNEFKNACRASVHDDNQHWDWDPDGEWDPDRTPVPGFYFKRDQNLIIMTKKLS